MAQDVVNPINPIPVAPKFSTSQTVDEMETALLAFDQMINDLEAKFRGNTAEDIKANNYFQDQEKLAAATMAKVLKEKYAFLQAFSIAEIVLMIEGPQSLKAQLRALAKKFNATKASVKKLTISQTNLTSQLTNAKTTLDGLNQSLANVGTQTTTLNAQITNFKTVTIPADQTSVSTAAQKLVVDMNSVVTYLDNAVSNFNPTAKALLKDPTVDDELDASVANAYISCKTIIDRLRDELSAVPPGTTPTEVQIAAIKADRDLLGPALANMDGKVDNTVYTPTLKENLFAFTRNVPFGGFDTHYPLYLPLQTKLDMDVTALGNAETQLNNLPDPATLQTQIKASESTVSTLTSQKAAITAKLKKAQQNFLEIQAALLKFQNHASALQEDFALVQANDPVASQIILQLRQLLKTP